jgi:hypothetical protein
MKKKITYYALAVFALSLFTIILWEQVRDSFFATFDNSVTVVREEEKVELTLDALISAKAESWLKSPEAAEYARTQVTEEVINELGKH